MSEHEQEPRIELNQSKFKLVRNSKGDPQWEISVVEGATKELLDSLRSLALEQYVALEDALLVAR